MGQDMLKQILSKLDKMEVDIADIKVGQQKLEARQQKLEAGQQKLEAGQQKLEAAQQKLEAGQQKLEVDIAAIQADVIAIQKDTERIPYVEQAVSELNQEAIATSAKVEQLQEMAEEHKLTLRILSVRSIEQEAKLMRSR